MDKKEYVLKTLELFKDTWDLAKAWIILINQTDVDQAILDIIIKTIDTSIEQMKNIEDKKKLLYLKEHIEILKQKEKTSKADDQSSLAKLDDILASL